jgi:fumarylacetoacetase
MSTKPHDPNHPALRSWVDVPPGSDFPVQNIPFGIFSTADRKSRACTRIGDHIVDLSVLADAGWLGGLDMDPSALGKRTLNAFLKYGKLGTRRLRARLSELLTTGMGEDDQAALRERALVHADLVTMHLPVAVADYTDFYSSREHATNVGTMFRDPSNALLPNWLHLPVGYHGRSSSIVPSGAPIHRPCGQYKTAPDAPPVFGASRQLDFELETAFITYQGKPLGERITTAEAEGHIFGLVLFNDWSARDIQAWEYVPLGPFLGKNFASSMSPWVITLDALKPFYEFGPQQTPPPLPYLQCAGPQNVNVHLQVSILPQGGAETVVCQSNMKYLYWSMAQQLAHHTVNGCNVRLGDVMASGTISGPDASSFGSMLELAWKGTRPITLADGSQRSFVHDGDTVVMRGHAQALGVRIGFGEVRTEVLPAR